MRVRKFAPCAFQLRMSHELSVFTVKFWFTTEFSDESRHLYFDQQSIVFEEDPEADPIVVQVVRDHKETVENHFINYYVTQAKPAPRVTMVGISFPFRWFEGNHIEVIANKWLIAPTRPSTVMLGLF